MVDKTRKCLGYKEGSNEVYISEWQEFLQTVYVQKSVPDWNNKLEDIQEFTNEETSDEPNQPCHSIEDWMILADLSSIPQIPWKKNRYNMIGIQHPSHIHISKSLKCLAG